jgi:hypothetical protein
MKGIYLTPEGKQEIEAKIAELEEYKDSDSCKDSRDWSFISGKQSILKEILSSATILPVETNMSYVKSQDFGDEFTIEYPNGVIIQPKQ